MTMDAGFPDSTSVAEAADEARFESMRAEPRDSMLLMATLHRASGETVQIKVRNLSAGGLMAETPTGLLKDEAIEVELRGIGLVPGRVAWVAGGRVGLSFAHTVDHKLARKPVTGGVQPQLVKASKTIWRPGLR